MGEDTSDRFSLSVRPKREATQALLQVKDKERDGELLNDGHALKSNKAAECSFQITSMPVAVVNDLQHQELCEGGRGELHDSVVRLLGRWQQCMGQVARMWWQITVFWQ